MRPRWRLRRELKRVKAYNDRVFQHAYECSGGISAIAARGDKARLRFALDTMKLNASYAREKELVRLLRV